MTGLGPYVLALDQGTTSSRALLFRVSGELVYSVQKEVRPLYPQAGWVEHDPETLWQSQATVACQCLAQSGVPRSQIIGLGLTNQRETSLLWNRRSGRPLGPAIVWQDRRTSNRCEELCAKGWNVPIQQITGLFPDPYFSATKIEWMLNHYPEARAQAANGELCFGTVDSWILWKLTQGRIHATDASNASRTMLFALQKQSWDDQLCDLFTIPLQILPNICDSNGPFGHVQAAGPWHGLPIGAVLGDQQAALFGHRCHSPGMAKCTYGTGCFLLMQSGTTPVYSQNRLLTTVAWRCHGQTNYALEGAVFNAGSLIQWLRDELGIIESAPDCDRLAATVPDSNGTYIVPAFTGLGSPYWDARARGLIAGLTRGVNKAHLCRAALEAIALQTMELVRSMEADSGVPLRELRVDGGAAKSDLLLQLQSDLLQVPVSRPPCVESTAWGAARLAALSLGVWSAPGPEAEIPGQPYTTFQPKEMPHWQEFLSGWKKAVDRSRAWME